MKKYSVVRKVIKHGFFNEEKVWSIQNNKTGSLGKKNYLKKSEAEKDCKKLNK